jgi:phosphoribosylanthranilate isomerase
MVKVKICGIQHPKDALVAAEAGADFVGVVFVPNRRRRISPEKAREITERLKGNDTFQPRVVGLFANQPVDEVNGIASRCRLDMVQLCGGETPDYCRQVKVPVIKVLHVPAGPHSPEMLNGLMERMAPFVEQGHLITLDRLVEGLQGGTGAAFDWRVAADLSERGCSYILAGGLKPGNVALVVERTRPWGVDVSSGVETDGAKDEGKIRRFIAEAKDTG